MRTTIERRELARAAAVADKFAGGVTRTINCGDLAGRESAALDAAGHARRARQRSELTLRNVVACNDANA